MDKDRIKELLRAIHSCGESGCQEDCDAACEMLEQDPELQAWFEEELGGFSEIDNAVAEKLKCCCAPEGCEEQCRDQLDGARGSLVRFALPLLASAALLLGGFYIGRGLVPSSDDPKTIVAPSGQGINEMRSDLATLVSNRDFSIQHKGESIDELSKWLVAAQAPAGEMGAAIMEKEGIGCAVLEWNANSVSMICFRDKSCGGGGVVHLFAIDRSAFGADIAVDAVAKHQRTSGLDTAGWVSADKVFLMVGDDPEVELDSLL